MLKSITPNYLFFKFSDFSKGTISYILVSMLGIINLIFYEFNPELYANSTNLLSFVIIPLIVIITGINLRPKFLFKGKGHTNEYENVSEETEQTQFSENSMPAVNDAADGLNPEIAALIANSSKPDIVNNEYENVSEETEQTQFSENSMPVVNDAADGLNPEIAALIANSSKPDIVNNEAEDQQEDPINLELDSIIEPVKKELSEFRQEIKEIKNKLEKTHKTTKLLESYKDTIFDLKAFKTEIENPLKFIEGMTQEYKLKNSIFVESSDKKKSEKHYEKMENIFVKNLSPVISEAPFSEHNEGSTNTNENVDRFFKSTKLILEKNYTVEQILQFLSITKSNIGKNTLIWDDIKISEIPESFQQLYYDMQSSLDTGSISLEEVINDMYGYSIRTGTTNKLIENYFSYLVPNKSLTNLDNLDEGDNTWQQ